MEKPKAPHSNTLAWRIPWMEEPDGLQSMGLQRVGHHWVTSLHFLNLYTWNLHHDFKKWTSPSLQMLSYAPSQSIPQPLPPKTCRCILLFLEFSINGIIQCTFLVCFLSFRVILVRFVLVVVVPLARWVVVHWYGYIVVCLFIHLLMRIWVFSCLEPLGRKLLWMFVYKSLFGQVLSLLLCKYPGIEWMDHVLND